MRSIFVLGEIVTVCLLLLAIITQVIIPAIRGTAMFPIFRRERKLRDGMIELNQAQQEAELADALEQRRREYFGTTTQAETDAAEVAAIDARNAKEFAESMAAANQQKEQK